MQPQMFRISKVNFTSGIILWGLGIATIITGLFDDRTPTTLAITGRSDDLFVNSPVVQTMNRNISIILLGLAILLILYRLFRNSGYKKIVIDKDVAFIFLGSLIFSISIFISSMYGAFQGLNYRVLYQSFFILALILYLPNDYRQSLITIRTILFTIILGSILLFVFKPEQASIVTRSWIPIINYRLYGLTYHPNTLGTLCCLFLFIIFVIPYKSRNLTILLASIAGLALLLTQSKTSWAIFIVGIFLLINEPKKLINSDITKVRKITNIAIILLILVGAVMITYSKAIILFISQILGENFSLTLISRTSVWDASLKVFKQYPIFGYGPTLWDLNFRNTADLPTVGHSHNQLIQTLAESGLIGFLGLSIHLFTLVRFVSKTKGRLRGFSLALLASILLKSITETPFNNYHIDTPFFIYVITIYMLILALVNNKHTSRDIPQPKNL